MNTKSMLLTQPASAQESKPEFSTELVDRLTDLRLRLGEMIKRRQKQGEYNVDSSDILILAQSVEQLNAVVGELCNLFFVERVDP